MNNIESFERIKYTDLQKYIDKINTGDILARNKVLAHYEKHISKIIEKYFNNETYDKQELYQVGFVALMECLEKYSTKKARVISRKVNELIYEKIQNYIDNENEYNYNLEQKNIEYIEYVQETDESKIIWEIIEKLPDKKKSIIYLFLNENYTLEKIGKIYNLSRQRVDQILKECITTIKNELDLNKTNKFKDNNSNEQKCVNNTNDSIIFRVINKLPKLKRNFICSYIYGNYSIEEIEKLYNLSQNYINDEINKTITSIKEQISLNINQLKNNTNFFKTLNRHLNKPNDRYILEYLSNNENLLIELIKKLPKLEKDIIYLYLYENYPIKTISKLYYLSYDHTRKIINKIIILIKEQIFLQLDHEIILKLFRKNSNEDIFKYVNTNPNLVFKATKKLFENEKQVIYAYLFEDYSIEKIAYLYDTSYNCVEELINKFITSIKQINNLYNENKINKLTLKRIYNKKYTFYKNNTYKLNIISGKADNVEIHNIFVTTKELKEMKRFISDFIKNEDTLGSNGASRILSEDEKILKLIIAKK